mgnify:CR=1 FL=1
MNYVLELILVGLLLCLVSSVFTLTTKIAIKCSCIDGLKTKQSIPYVIVANLLFFIYLPYYFFYRATYVGKSCLEDK